MQIEENANDYEFSDVKQFLEEWPKEKVQATEEGTK